MMVNHPHEWDKFFVKGKTRMFSKDTPADIIKKAKEINAYVFSISGRQWFRFESEEGEKDV